MLQPLLPAIFADYPLEKVSLLRLDALDAHAPGNKRYKLSGYVEQARASNVQTLLSFGGAWSNHLHALAAVGAQQGLHTVGIVRCEAHEMDSPTLADARAWGMEIVPVGRTQYRQRHLPEYQAQLQARYAPCIVIPEGGASLPGARGCAAIADLVLNANHRARRVVVPVGTGTTLAGIVAALPPEYEVIGISALKGAADIERNVESLLEALLPSGQRARWQVMHEHHCGGFAKVNDDLKRFMQVFESGQNVALDPLYTAKMLLAVSNLRETGQWDEREPLIAIHTGGLQGRRGFSWLRNELAV